MEVSSSFRWLSSIARSHLLVALKILQSNPLPCSVWIYNVVRLCILLIFGIGHSISLHGNLILSDITKSMKGLYGVMM